MSLDKYQEKRDFKKTSEPKGDASSRRLPRRVAPRNDDLSVIASELRARSNTEKNIFVIQKHHARNLHYDFRLAMNGVLKSWAIPKGPSEKPSDKRLAVMTEDHPMAYADFAGVIPEGEYGAGKVEIWDQGTWEPISNLKSWEKERKLEFILHGEKLKGDWVLIGLKDSPKNWLLIKKKTSE